MNTHHFAGLPGHGPTRSSAQQVSAQQITGEFARVDRQRLRWRVSRYTPEMVGLVSDNLDRIRDACKRRGVSFLELVGSAARDDFDPNRSDIDVLVDFPDQAPDLFGAYMGLREDLAGILGRPVDVITLRGVRNPLLLESLRRDAIRLYAA